MRRGNFTLRTKLVCATAAVVSLAGLPLVYLGYATPTATGSRAQRQNSATSRA